MTDATIKTIGGSRTIETLYVGGTLVGDPSVPLLIAMPAIQRLRLVGNKVDYVRAVRLHNTMPKIEFYLRQGNLPEARSDRYLK